MSPGKKGHRHLLRQVVAVFTRFEHYHRISRRGQIGGERTSARSRTYDDVIGIGVAALGR